MKSRLINCDFLTTEAFNDKLSNKAKLLYVIMFINGDDKGFVSNTNTIISTLTKNDELFTNEINLSLLENDYPNALIELINRGYVYEFRDNHDNKVHLIRHWFIHNKWRKGLWTNYGSFLKQVELVEGKYVLKENSINENTINEIKEIKDDLPLNKDELLNEIKTNHQVYGNQKENEEEHPKLEDFLREKGVSKPSQLTQEQISEWVAICSKF